MFNDVYIQEGERKSKNIQSTFVVVVVVFVFVVFVVLVFVGPTSVLDDSIGPPSLLTNGRWSISSPSDRVGAPYESPAAGVVSGPMRLITEASRSPLVMAGR